jgi:hypothetical protein
LPRAKRDAQHADVQWLAILERVDPKRVSRRPEKGIPGIVAWWSAVALSVMAEVAYLPCVIWVAAHRVPVVRDALGIMNRSPPPSINAVTATSEKARAVKITIQVKAKDHEDAADYVRSVADQIEEGYASGYVNRHAHWTSSDELPRDLTEADVHSEAV